ncbi:MAG: hypothetical protein NUV67_02360 [archaeon]|nr:hypothetical protein [archaeon]
MLLEAIGALASLDLGWFVHIATQNLFITFALLATFYMFLEGQNFVVGSIVIFITFFAFFDFEKILGIPFFTGKFLVIYYATKLAVLAIAETNEFLKKKLLFLSEVQFYGAFVVSLLFFR